MKGILFAKKIYFIFYFIFYRLEFLGDAVLDFLVTRHIFVENKDITPGKNLKEMF
jgi:hypothetical protein